MKYSRLFLFVSICSITLLMSCEKETNNSFPLLGSSPKISIVKYGEVDQKRFYYEGNRLVETQRDGRAYSEENDSTYLYTSYLYFEYEEDKLSRAYNDYGETTISYEGADMIINGFDENYFEESITFNNYETAGSFRVELFMRDDVNSQFSPTFDEDNNLLFADDDAGNPIFDSFIHPGLYYLKPYFGDFNYTDKNHYAKNLDIEVQLFLFQKPLNKCIENINEGYKVVEYDYEFNADNYPTSVRTRFVYPSNDTLFFNGTTEYIYE